MANCSFLDDNFNEILYLRTFIKLKMYLHPLLFWNTDNTTTIIIRDFTKFLIFYLYII